MCGDNLEEIGSGFVSSYLLELVPDDLDVRLG